MVCSILTSTSLPFDALRFRGPWRFPLLIIRPARVGDVPGIYEQILVHAEQKQMIRRSMAELYESIREFIVAVDDHNRVVGCVALHVFWEDLAEIRGLAVAEHVQGRGVGRRWLRPAGNRPASSKSKSLFALTNAVGFFERCGYHRIDKSELPQRIWNECVRCPSFPNCQEIALIRSTEPEQPCRPACSETGGRRPLTAARAMSRVRGLQTQPPSHHRFALWTWQKHSCRLSWSALASAWPLRP